MNAPPTPGLEEFLLYQRSQKGVAYMPVATTDSPLIGQDLSRVALVISAPPPPALNTTSDGTLVSGADTSSGGAKCTYTVPAGVQATLTSATFGEFTGTGVICTLRLTRGATTVGLFTATTSGVFLGPIALQSGDVLAWVVTTVVGLSASDFSINIALNIVPNRVTISLDKKAVLDNGINLYPGGTPLIFTIKEHTGIIKQEFRAIASTSAVTLGVWTATLGPT